MCRTSIYAARNNLSNFVKIAERGEPVELTRYDKPVAVIISYEEYEKIEKPSFLEKLADNRKRRNHRRRIRNHRTYSCSWNRNRFRRNRNYLNQDSIVLYFRNCCRISYVPSCPLV